MGRSVSTPFTELRRPSEPVTFRFAADREVPNNPSLPLIVYRQALRLEPAFDPAAVFEAVFAANGWSLSWRNGIYAFRHFHTRAHEVLGVARGGARVEFGGAAGQPLEIAAGDVAILPAGTGHRCLAQSADLLVVGAYPETDDIDQKRAGEVDVTRALADIAQVAIPAKDPVYGVDGPLPALWRTSGRGS